MTDISPITEADATEAETPVSEPTDPGFRFGLLVGWFSGMLGVTLGIVIVEVLK